MIYYISHWIQTLFFPPGGNLLLILIGFFIWQYSPFIGKIIVAISFFSLWLLCTPWIAQILINGLQYQYPALSTHQLREDKQAAIVVLGAGNSIGSPEYGQAQTVSVETLIRLRYAAYLYQKIKAPILVSGYDLTHPTIHQTEIMAHALKEYFNVPVRWHEDKGYNTAQEAIFSAEILKRSGIKKIYLVTSAYHMPRSVHAFQNKGFEIIPAPTEFISTMRPSKRIAALFPNIDALNVSYTALHEYVGSCFYRLYY